MWPFAAMAAVAVEALFALCQALDELIDHHVAGTGVEATIGRCGQDRDVGDAADVERDAVHVFGLAKSRCRRTGRVARLARRRRCRGCGSRRLRERPDVRR